MHNTSSPAVPASDDGSTEALIRRNGADVAPRVTPADVEGAIVAQHFFTAAEGAAGACPQQPVPRALHLLTFCVLTLRNGFTVTGESACASPENFNAEVGRKVARDNAVSKAWPLLGYALRERLHAGASGDYRSRMQTEALPAVAADTNEA
jgi:hypothetical protein